MREIEIGDYIRTTFGIITKIVKIKDTMLPVGGFVNGIGGTHEHRMQKGKLYITKSGAAVLQEDIKKNSKEIRNLIEEGDYVNGYNVTDVLYGGYVYIYKIGVGTEELYDDYQIKSIVTKEQFANVEYRLENGDGD